MYIQVDSSVVIGCLGSRSSERASFPNTFRWWPFYRKSFKLWILQIYDLSSLKISLSRFVFVILSIIVNHTCSLNLWPFFWKCLSANIALGSFTSFLWLFNLMLNGVSFLPTYCKLHIMHSIRYSVFQFVLQNIFQVLFVCLLALECCCSFHLFGTYISSFWPAWCAFTFF